MKPNLLEDVRSRVLLADGAIGTELLRQGLDKGGFGEAWNLERPDAVMSVHSAYRKAGAQVITTNSFQGNRFTLANHHLESKVTEINRRAAELACAAAGGEAWVLGSIGPFGGLLQPLGTTSAGDAFSWFTEQVRALLAGGADGIVIETMTAREEIEVAIRAARSAGAPLIAAMMTFGKGKSGYRTMMGVSPEEAVTVMHREGADVIGSNCGNDLSMDDYAAIIRELRTYTDKPLIVRPNAGRPDLVGINVQYRQTPEAMAQQVGDLVRAGANIVGGCCGTTPEHIRLFSRALP